MFISRRLWSVTSNDEFILIYFCVFRSLIEYPCPQFVSLSADALGLQKIQNRCLKIMRGVEAPDLLERRLSMAMSTFQSLPSIDILVKDLFPASLPSDRLSVPFCRISLRRSSPIPSMSMVASSEHYD